MPEVFFSNIEMNFNGQKWLMYTEEELEDREKHPAMHVLGPDIYKTIRDMLSDEQFEELNASLQQLADNDVDGKSTAGFPKEMTDWYYNTNNAYYQTANDEAFVRYVRKHYLGKEEEA
jgi:hypothetical protein